ncbi:DNA repair protein RadC [Zoogloea sp.]|uniref:RadC family protein n=1 Tax=Zoogloea sp. TaxID=49181 RepID=UPI0035AE3FEE
MTFVSAIQQLPDAELLRIILGEESAARIANRPLMEVFRLLQAHFPLEDAETCVSLRPLTAARELLARMLNGTLSTRDCMTDPKAVRELLRMRLADLQHEVFVVMLLDAQNQLIECVELFRGTLTETAVYPREVVKLALSWNAAAVIFAHNHPSGVAEPSQADEGLTKALKQALALVDVRVLDHFIVAGGASPLSFTERGLL